MNREKALEKIRKLLALAGSDNPHESAAAMRHAMALMRKHGIDQETVELSQVKKEQITSATRSAPIWLWSLACVVASAFGCKCWEDQTLSRSSHIAFLGVGAKPKLATYTFTVLRRRLSCDRAAYYRTTRGKRANRIRRADQFALAWVDTVSREVARFAGPVAPIVERAYEITKRDLGMTSSEFRLDSSPMDLRAALAGRSKGAAVSLHNGIDGFEQRRIA